MVQTVKMLVMKPAAKALLEETWLNKDAGPPEEGLSVFFSSGRAAAESSGIFLAT